MTRNELAKILEQFAVCVIHTAMSDMEADDRYRIISSGIDILADTVMICNKRKLPSPSAN